MSALHLLILLFVAIGSTSLVLTRSFKNQALIYSLYGLILSLLYATIQSAETTLPALIAGSALAIVLLGGVVKARRIGLTWHLAGLRKPRRRAG